MSQERKSRARRFSSSRWSAGRYRSLSSPPWASLNAPMTLCSSRYSLRLKRYATRAYRAAARRSKRERKRRLRACLRFCQLLTRQANAGGVDGREILRRVLARFQGFLDDSLEIRPLRRRPLSLADASADLDDRVDALVERARQACEPQHRIEQLQKQPGPNRRGLGIMQLAGIVRQHADARLRERRTVEHGPKLERGVDHQI